LTVQQVTRTIPIVFTWVSDSVGSGYVANLAHPGGNITGFHSYEPALGAKWMGILKELAPAVRRVAFVHVPEITANVAFMRVGDASSAALGMKVSAVGAPIGLFHQGVRWRRRHHERESSRRRLSPNFRRLF